MPSYAKMKYQSLAVTAVGIAQGIRIAARSRARPAKVLPMMTAIPKPMTTSMDTVTTVKNAVFPTAPQNCDPSVPGGQGTNVPDAEVHCCRIQCV